MENFSFENINKSRKENILKSFSNIYETPQSDIDQEISKAIELDVIEKGGKRATLGEIREWSGKKYQKTTQGWKPYGGKGLSHGDVDVTGQKDTPIPKEKKDKIITSAMVEKIKEKNPQSDKEIVGAMRMYAQEVKNTYTESEYSEMLDEYKEITGKEFKKEDSKNVSIKGDDLSDKQKEALMNLAGNGPQGKEAMQKHINLKENKTFTIKGNTLTIKYEDGYSSEWPITKEFIESFTKKEDTKPKEEKKEEKKDGVFERGDEIEVGKYKMSVVGYNEDGQLKVMNQQNEKFTLSKEKTKELEAKQYPKEDSKPQEEKKESKMQEGDKVKYNVTKSGGVKIPFKGEIEQLSDDGQYAHVRNSIGKLDFIPVKDLNKVDDSKVEDKKQHSLSKKDIDKLQTLLDSKVPIYYTSIGSNNGNVALFFYNPGLKDAEKLVKDPNQDELSKKRNSTISAIGKLKIEGVSKDELSSHLLEANNLMKLHGIEQLDKFMSVIKPTKTIITDHNGNVSN